MRKEWVIIVAQVVTGKSKFPHKKVGKFTRYKPWPYRNSNKPHRIVYARSFLGTDEEALEKAEQVDQEMFNTYIFGMSAQQLAHTCVSEYTVVLHNVTEDVSKQMSTTSDGSDSEDEGFMYTGVTCSNQNLGRWGVIKGLR